MEEVKREEQSDTEGLTSDPKEEEKEDEVQEPQEEEAVEVPKEEEKEVFLDDIPVSTDSAKAIKQMIWINTSVTWIALTTITITLLVSLLDKVAYQAIAFMLIGAFSSIYWYKWNNRIQEFIK